MSIHYQYKFSELKDFEDYLPLINIANMHMGFDKKHKGFDRIEYWHVAILDPPCCGHDFMFTYSNN